MIRRGDILAIVTAAAIHAAAGVVTLRFDHRAPEPIAQVRLAQVPPPEPEPELEPEPQPEPEPEPQPEPEPKPQPKAEPEPEPEPKPQAKPLEPPPPESPPEPPNPPPAAEVPDLNPAPSRTDNAPKIAPPTPKRIGVADLRAYGRGIHGSVMSHRRYPVAARRLGLEGTTKVQISIDRNGRLVGKPSVVRSSGHELLDKEAVRMVEAATPFAGLPAGFDKPVMTIAIPVEFRLHD